MLYWAGFESMLCATLPKNKSGCVGKTISNKRRSMSEIFFVCRLIKGACQGESVLLLMYLRGKECVCRIDMGIAPPPFTPFLDVFLEEKFCRCQKRLRWLTTEVASLWRCNIPPFTPTPFIFLRQDSLVIYQVLEPRLLKEATQHPEIPTSIFVILLCEGEIAFGTEGLGSQPSEWVWGGRGWCEEKAVWQPRMSQQRQVR